MSNIPNRAEVNRLLYPEPIRGTDTPRFYFLAILNRAEDVQKFHELCTSAGITLRVLTDNVLLVFSYDSLPATGKYLKTVGHPQYEFALASLGEVENF